MLKQVPSVLNAVRQDGRIDSYQLATSNGEAIGWAQLSESKGNGYEWSTNQVFRLKAPATDLGRPQIFSSKEGALNGADAQDLPDDLWDEDVVFPVLERDVEKGIFKVGHPLPRTLKINIDFPLWIKNRDDEGILVGTSELLVDKKVVETAIQSLQYLREQWGKMKDFESYVDTNGLDRVHQLLDAQQRTEYMLATGETLPFAIQSANEEQREQIETSLSNSLCIAIFATIPLHDALRCPYCHSHIACFGAGDYGCFIHFSQCPVCSDPLEGL